MRITSQAADNNMEDGEVHEGITPAQSPSHTPEQGYDPSFEWPGDTSADETLSSEYIPTRKIKGTQPVFRLIATRSSILSPKHNLALIDGYKELQFGRDVASTGTTTPRLRLKEMEVSKLHATAYWDGSRREWGIVDMGSKHGTFLRPGAAMADEVGVRLSPPRVASVPRRLHHLDCLTIGSTTFLVHIHESQLPCEECSPTGGRAEIPLFPVQKGTAVKRSRDVAGLDTDTLPPPLPPRDPKRALTMLKRSLLTHHEHGLRPASPGDASNRYMDRSARRRALYPASHPDAPGVPSWSESPSPRPEAFPEPAVMSQPPTPLPPSNMGHRLLMKQGWQPGTALGTWTDSDDGRTSLVDPLVVSSSANRAGIGVKEVPVGHLNWKDSAKQRRWSAVKYDKDQE